MCIGGGRKCEMCNVLWHTLTDTQAILGPPTFQICRVLEKKPLNFIFWCICILTCNLLLYKASKASFLEMYSPVWLLNRVRRSHTE